MLPLDVILFGGVDGEKFPFFNSEPRMIDPQYLDVIFSLNRRVTKVLVQSFPIQCVEFCGNKIPAENEKVL